MKTAGDILQAKGQELICVDPESTIYQAALRMNEKKIGAILIKKDEEIVGIWTERDLLKNITEEGFDPKKARIKDYMTTDLRYAEYHDHVYRLLDKFLGMRLRHLLIRKDGKYVGILSTGDVIKASLNEKNKELKELNAMLSWEYYENWRWESRK
ncbi:MAG: CBS domain-containing protein [Calditrichia bacterium]